MNERINELFEQAKEESSQWLGSKPATTITYDELEKFAELIVRECCDCLNTRAQQIGDVTTTVGTAGKIIKEHFGVIPSYRMNDRIKELILRTDSWCDQNFPTNWTDEVDQYLPLWNEKFAKLIIQECADYIRTNYDSWDAEPLAFNMERDYGLHGDYAE